MKKIIEMFEKKYGYKPTIFELYPLYTSGLIFMTNSMENELIKEFEKAGLR